MHICPVCEARYGYLTPLAKHLFLHLNRISYVCFACMDILTSRYIKSYVTDNAFFVSENNSESSERTNNCSNLCGECHTFIPDYKDYIFHIQVHTKELHQCSTCILSFPSDIDHSEPKMHPVYNCFRCSTTFDGDSRCNIFEPLIFCNIEILESGEPNLIPQDKNFKQLKLLFTIQKRSRENSAVADSLISTSHRAESFSKEKLSNFSASHCAESRKVPSKGKPSNFSASHCAESRKVLSKGKPSNFSASHCAESRKVLSKGKPSNFSASHCAESRKVLSKGKPSNFSAIHHAESRKVVSKGKPPNFSASYRAESRKVVSKGKPSNFSLYLLANAHLKTNGKSNETAHKNHDSVKTRNVGHHSKCTKQYGENITIQPSKLNCSEIEAQVSLPHNYQIIKSSGSKLVLKLQHSKTGIASMNVSNRDSFDRTINQESRTSPRFIVPLLQQNEHINGYRVRDLNSETGSKLLLIHRSNKDSSGCTTNLKNETTQKTPCTTNQLNTYGKNPRPTMSPSNSSHNLKGTERLPETTTVSSLMPSSSASSALPLVRPTISPANSSHNLKGTDKLQETTTVSSVMPSSSASSEIPLIHPTMSPANSSHILKGLLNDVARNPFLDFQTSVNTANLNASDCLPKDCKRKPKKSDKEKVGNLTSVINSLHKLSLLGKDFQASLKQQNSSVHQKSTSGGYSPKITGVYYTSKDSPIRQIKQRKDYRDVWQGCESCVDDIEQNRNGLCVAMEMMESKSSGDDAEQNESGLWLVREMMESKSSGDDAEQNINGFGIVKDYLASALNTVEDIPSKEVPAKSVFPENVCSTKSLRNNETSSRNVLSSYQIENSEKDIISSTDSLLIMNETEMPGNQALNVPNFEMNQCNDILINDLQSLKDPDAGQDNSFVQNNLIPVSDVQNQSVKPSIFHVLFKGFKVGNSIFINYNQIEESTKHLLFPFRKFEILNSGGWLSIPIKMLMPTYTEKASNDTVCSNGLSIQESSSLVPDQNNIIYDVGLQSAGAEDLSKHQNIAVNGLQYLNISPSDSFQNSQHSVRLDRSKIININSQSELHSSKSLNNENLESSYPNHKSFDCNGSFQSSQHFVSLERPEIITVDDSQSGLNNSKPLNNENSYPNHKFPERNNSFQNNTVPMNKSQYNISAKFSIDDKFKCLNNDLFNVSQNLVGLEQLEVASFDASQPDLNNSKPLTDENSQNIVNVNRMPLEHNDQGNNNPETISDDPESVRSTESKDCDKSEFFECGDVLVASSLLESVENSKAYPVHFGNLRSENNDSKSVERTSIPNSTNNRPPSSGIEDENWNELKQLYKLKRLSVQLNRLPSVICRSLYSSENEKAERVLNNSKKLSVVLNKLPRFVCSYATYKIYAQSQEQKSALRRKKKLESVDKNIPDQDSNLLSVSLENNNSVTGIHVNNQNASTSVDVKTVRKKRNFLLEACCSTHPTELANKLHIADVHIMENAATVENNFVPRDHLIQQSLENPVLSFSSHIKKELDICSQQFAEQMGTPFDPIASTATDMETSCINSDFQSLSSGSVAPTEMTALNSLQVSVPSTSNSNELNSSPVSVPSTSNAKNLDSSLVSVPSTSNANKLNSCPQQSTALTENSYCCDNLYTFELLNRERVPMSVADSPSPSSNASSLEICEDLHQVNDESGCNLSGPPLPSDNDGFYLMSNYQNKLNTDCHEKFLENLVAFSFWKTKYQVKYLRNRIKHINETLAKVVENRRNMKLLKLRILLNRLPDSIYEKHLKKKPIMLSSVLPTITEVRSLS